MAGEEEEKEKEKVELTPTEKAVGGGIACTTVGALNMTKEGAVAIFDAGLEVLGAKSKDGSIANSPSRLAKAAGAGCDAGKEIIAAHPEIVTKTEEAGKQAAEIIWDLLKKAGNGAKKFTLEKLKEYQNQQGGSTIPYCTTPEQTNCVKR